ncbi:ATP-binding cassette sub-family A member 6-like, partial [Pseudonaja textilis]|uniref:ATP-binding cassette sub-family A member 6-like n=1 Tax=Pseudonaja textilis TaxID=8673 RepID=UPI000EA990D3
LLLIGVILAPYIIEFTTYSVWLNLQYEEIHPGLYFEPGKQFFRGTSGLLVLNNTGGKIDNFIQALKSQSILMDVISGDIVSDQLVHNGAIKVDLENKKYRFTLMCHMEITNCYPVLVNIISNAFLHMFNSTAHLRTWSHVFTEDHFDNFLWISMETYMVATSIVLPAFPPQFAMRSNQDYMVAFFLGYSISIVLFLYIIAFVFRQKKHTASFWSVTSILVMLLLFIISITTSSISMPYIRHLLSFFVPMFPVTNFIMSFTYLLGGFPTDEHDVSTETQLFISTFMPYLQSIILIFLLRYLVMKYDQTIMRRDPIFRISPQRKRTHQNPEELSQADDRDVLDERTRVQSALASVNEGEKPVLIVHDLRKEYKHGNACSSPCFKRKEEKKVATRNVSFCVKKGLIGMNYILNSVSIVNLL